MATVIDNKAENKTVLLMRRLVAEKKVVRQQLRHALSTDSDLRKAIAELDLRRAQQDA